MNRGCGSEVQTEMYVEGHSASSDQPKHVDIDVTSQKSSCDDAVLHATAFC